MSIPALNASTSRTGTPVRAITSTISNRAVPSIPPASEAYEPLVKALFRHRLRFVLLASGAATWITFTTWAYWQNGCLEKVGFLGALTLPMSPWVLFSTILAWFSVALPISVLRKIYLSTHRSGATSPLAIVKHALSQPSTKVATIVYLISAISALVLHLVMVYAYEIDTYGDPKLTLFVKSKKHPHYLNGRLLFLVITQLSIALAFALRGATIDRFVYKWSLTRIQKKNPIYVAILLNWFISAIFTTFAIALAALIFAVLRFWLPVLYKIPILSFILRPFTAHFLKGPWTISLPLRHYQLFFRAWFLAFSTFFVWEFVDRLFDEAIVETAPIATLSADPNTTLVSGLSSEDRVFAFFAFSELRELAIDTSASASARRTALFGDQKSSLNLWASLSRQTLLVLGRDYQTFLRRGQPEPVVPSPAPPQPKIIDTPSIATPTPLLRNRVFKTTPESPGQAALDALASDGPIAKAIDISANATHVPELFRSVEHRVVSPITEETKKNVKSVTGLGSRWRHDALAFAAKVGTNYSPVMLREVVGGFSAWLNESRKSRVVEASLPFWEMDIIVIDALSRLTSASLTEDRFGVVQRDIPKILEAMISFLSSVEQYQIELAAHNEPLAPTASPKEKEEREIDVIETQKAKEILIHVGDGLKEGIQLIVNTFGDKLSAFKFPPRIANKLQLFLDYS
ncbi:nucleoporin protein Ndc1-Nup [Pholiota molesta]|nr:nucleoporin protein Ndc1-Nup [Pholiota molesta]